MNIICAFERGNAQADLLVRGLQASSHRVSVCGVDLQSVKEKIESNIPVDVIHFYNATLVDSHLADADLDTVGESPTCIQYDTSEIRTRAEAIRHNPYANLDPHYRDEAVTSRLERLSRLFPACIVKNHEAAEYAAKHHRRVYIVPYVIDLKEIDRLRSSPKPSNATPLIIHPCLGEAKGTEFIDEVMGRLQEEGYHFEYLRVEHSDHDYVLRKMQEADIVIDQLLHGSYGVTSVEAMAFGKPVISHIREDLRFKYHSTTPVVSASPATLYRKIVPLLKDAGLRESVGKAGREYVEKHHHSDAVIKGLLRVYEKETCELGHSPSSDRTIIFNSTTGAMIVEGEGADEDNFALEAYMSNSDWSSPDWSSPGWSSPNRPGTQSIVKQTTDDQGVIEDHTEPTDDVIELDDDTQATGAVILNEEYTATIDEADEGDNRTSDEQDEQVAFAPTTSPLLNDEDTEKVDLNMESNDNIYELWNNPFIYNPRKNVAIVTKDAAETVNERGRMDNRSSYQHKKSLPFFREPRNPKNLTIPTKRTTPVIQTRPIILAKPAHGLGANCSAQGPVRWNSCRLMRMCHIPPNRYCVKNRSKSKSATYVSFDVSNLPSSCTITKAVMKLPVELKKNQKVSMVRIKQNWCPKRAKGTPPIVFPNPVDQLTTTSDCRVVRWKCTPLVKRWHRSHSKNYGVRISKRLRKQPTLIVKVNLPCDSKTTTKLPVILRKTRKVSNVGVQRTCTVLLKRLRRTHTIDYSVRHSSRFRIRPELAVNCGKNKK